MLGRRFVSRRKNNGIPDKILIIFKWTCGVNSCIIVFTVKERINLKFITKIFLLFCVLAFATSGPPAIAADADETLIQYAGELTSYTGLGCYEPDFTQRYLNYKILHADLPWETAIAYVNIGLDNPFYTFINQIENPANTDTLVNKYNQLPERYIPQNLQRISARYSSGIQYLRYDAEDAFDQMCTDASKIGLSIRAVSTYRSYATQSRIYFRKINPLDAETIVARDLVSARAGHSEHQLGLAVDVMGTGLWVSGTKEYKWYAENAHKYGFIIRYPEGKTSVTGYTFEPWHLRYLGKELATAVWESGLPYDEYYETFIDVTEKTLTAAVAVSQTSRLTENGESFLLSTYVVSGETYFKLRDLAFILNGTDLQFDILWNGEMKMISLISNQPYSSEVALSSFESGNVRNMTISQSSLQVGDSVIELPAYFAEGSNYYKLSDIALALGFSVSADLETGALTVSA